MVGGMNEIGLSWCPDVRTEENPSLGARDHALASFEIRSHPHKRKLVTAERHEMAVARRPGRNQRPYHLQPNDEAAALLAYALPPATPWRHEHERGEAHCRRAPQTALLTSHAFPGFLGHADAKSFQETVLSRRGDDHSVAVLHPLGPTQIETTLGEGGSYRARDVWPSFGPVQA